jgi:hypothetical protein
MIQLLFVFALVFAVAAGTAAVAVSDQFAVAPPACTGNC